MSNNFLTRLLKLKKKMKKNPDFSLEKDVILPFKIIRDSQKSQLKNNKTWTREERKEREKEFAELEEFLTKMEI